MSYPSSVDGRIVVIGGGVHAAIFAATRAAFGKSKPIVFEKTVRTGGVFSRLSRFAMNSINGASLDSVRTGPSRIPAFNVTDTLNYLPNSQFQLMSNTEYPNSREMALTISDTLMSTADVYTLASVTFDAKGKVTNSIGKSLGTASVIIWAAGLAMPNNDAPTIITAEQYLMNPNQVEFRNRRIAIVGGGDSAATVAEFLLGQSLTVVYERPDRFDWYGGYNMPTTKREWSNDYHARYMGISRHLPEYEITGVINPFATRGTIENIGNIVMVNGRIYDYVIDATGFKPVPSPVAANSEVYGRSGNVIARTNDGRIYRIGTAAELPSSAPVKSKFGASSAAIYSIGRATAEFAATMPEPKSTPS